MKTVTTISLTFLICSHCFAAGTSEVGNKPLSKANYVDWPNLVDAINDTSRVFQLWVNGNESFYYQGDTLAANRVLKEFAETDFPELHVVLLPGPGTTVTFGDANDVRFDYRINVMGGIARAAIQRSNLKRVYSLQPTMTIYLTENIKLQALQIPEEVKLFQLRDLESRFQKGLKNEDEGVKQTAQRMLDQLNSEFQRQGKEYQKLEKQISAIEALVKARRVKADVVK